MKKKKYRIYAHNFEETLSTLIGDFDDPYEAMKAIEDFHSDESKYPIIYDRLGFFACHTFEDLWKRARVYVEDLETGNYLTFEPDAGYGYKGVNNTNYELNTSVKLFSSGKEQGYISPRDTRVVSAGQMEGYRP